MFDKEREKKIRKHWDKTFILIMLIVPFLINGCAGNKKEAKSEDQKTKVEFNLNPGELLISIGGEHFATYSFEDPNNTRPYFSNVMTPCGIQATRNHPPKPEDPQDHASYHPGIWMSFGDINGNDYWRQKAKVEHEMFVEDPKEGPGKGTFTVRNYYMSDDGESRMLAELVKYTILVRPSGYLLIWDSKFSSDSQDFTFGDQEEMGFGFRVNTKITADYGDGQITNADGLKGEDETWGQASEWIDYSGPVGDNYIGMALMPDPDNFRPSWYHARNYGLIAANPFGRKAMEQGEESAITVEKGEEFNLRFGVLIYCSPTDDKVNIGNAYKNYLEIIK